MDPQAETNFSLNVPETGERKDTAQCKKYNVLFSNYFWNEASVFFLSIDRGHIVNTYADTRLDLVFRILAVHRPLYILICITYISFWQSDRVSLTAIEL